MAIKSEITGRYYDEKKAVFFRNPTQAMAYMNNGATLLDLLVSKVFDEKTGQKKNMFTFVFSKDDHNRLKMAWANHELT